MWKNPQLVCGVNYWIQIFPDYISGIIMQEYNMSDYGGGRSPAGKCVGWHYLTKEQYQKKKSVYEAKQAAKSSSAQDNLESRSWPLTYIQQ